MNKTTNEILLGLVKIQTALEVHAANPAGLPQNKCAALAKDLQTDIERLSAIVLAARTALEGESP